MGALVPQDAPAWSQFVRDFDGAYKSFADNRAALVALGPYIQREHPELVPQYHSMLARAAELAPKLQSLAQTRAQVAGWLGSAGNVYQRAVDLTSQAIEKVAGTVSAARRALGLGELAVLPIVAVVGLAAAGTALVAVTKWVADAFLFAKRLNAMQDLEAKGYAPAEAAAAVNRVMGEPNAPSGIERTASTLLWVVALIGLGLVVVPRLLPEPSRTRR